MDGSKGRGGGRQWRSRGGLGRGSCWAGGGRAGGGGRTGGPAVTRTFLALAAATAQDLTDRDGVTRPLLRRGALRLTTSSRAPVQRLGAGYLRIDPPTPEEFARAAASPPPPAIDAAPAARAEAAPPIEDAEIVPIEDAEIVAFDETETGPPDEAGDVEPR